MKVISKEEALETADNNILAVIYSLQEMRKNHAHSMSIDEDKLWLFLMNNLSNALNNVVTMRTLLGDK